MIDGAVIMSFEGISDFNALHSARHNEEAQLCAFDVPAIDGDDLRNLPLPGLEGLVSKHRDRPYRGGRQRFWVKVQIRKHQAFDRVKNALG